MPGTPVHIARCTSEKMPKVTASLATDRYRVVIEFVHLPVHLAKILVDDQDGLRYALDDRPTHDLNRQPLFGRECGADLDFDLFGRALADQQVVLLLHVLNDGF